MKKMLWVIILIVLVAFVFITIAYFQRPLNDRKIPTDLLIPLLGWLLYLASAFYNMNEKVYFGLRKQWDKIKKTTTEWEFGSKFTCSSSLDKKTIDNIEKSIINSKNKASRIEKSDDFLTLFINNKYQIKIKISDVTDKHFNLYFYTSTLTVPYSQIDDKMNEINEILDLLKNKHTIEKEDYELSIRYCDKNPYYGYWLRKIPSVKIVELNCKIEYNATNFKINKNTIFLNAPSFSILRKEVNKYILFAS